MAEYLIQGNTLTNIANAIRTKRGSSSSIAVSNMATEISKISTGVELNFEVVGGTTQPSNPIENCIWVNTNIEITGYIFQSSQPNASPGSIWIQTSSYNKASFNALKINNITIYPLSAKQCVDNIWVCVDAKIYQNNQWCDLWDGTLYNAGNEYEDLTGGWEVLGTASKQSNYINAICEANKVAAVYTKNTIDLTDKKTIFFTITNLVGDFYAAVHESIPTYQNTSEGNAYFGQSRATLAVTSNGTHSIDVSKITGSYYIWSGNWSKSTRYGAFISKIWME